MSTIGIDCRFASTASGLGRYTREIVSHLLERRDANHYALFVGSKDEEWIPRDYGTAFSLFTAPFPHYSAAEQVKFPALIRSAGADMLFAPHFNVPLGCPVPTVVTVHDMILHRYPNHASILKQLAYRFLFRQAVSRAKALIAVSAFTGKELTSFYGPRAARKLHVVPEAVSADFAQATIVRQQEVRVKYGLQKPFFLYVGNAKEHKNVQMLIEAFRLLSIDTCELVLVTGGKEATQLKAAPGVRFLQEVPEADLPALYSASLCFVSASLYEGFGLPLLESHACGAAAIVTDIPAFREFAPLGTVLVSPSLEAFAQAMSDPPMWKEGGPKRTWQDAAAETAEVFRLVLKRV